jgi:hypothetical protein
MVLELPKGLYGGAGEKGGAWTFIRCFTCQVRIVYAVYQEEICSIARRDGLCPCAWRRRDDETSKPKKCRSANIDGFGVSERRAN